MDLLGRHARVNSASDHSKLCNHFLIILPCKNIGFEGFPLILRVIGGNYLADIEMEVMRKLDQIRNFVRQDSSTCDTIDVIFFGSGKILDSHWARSRSACRETSLEGNRGCRAMMGHCSDFFRFDPN